MICENESVPTDRRVWGMGRTLTAAGCDVSIVCPQSHERRRARDESIAYEVLEGIRVHRFPLAFATGGIGGYVREYGSALRRTRQLVSRLTRQQPFDVVHVCNPPDFMFVAAWPALRKGARLVFDHHDLTPELFRARFGEGRGLLHALTKLSERASFRAADVVLSTNESYRRIARTRGRKSADQVFVVRNGPDTRRFRPVAVDESLKRGKSLLIGYVGVMAPQDGVDHALRALAVLRERRQDWHAVFAGEGDARSQLERLAQQLGIGEAVEFVGWLGDEAIMRLLSTCDVCLAPEPPTPLNDVSTMVKIAEYLAMARPVVAYDLQESRFTAGDAAVYATPDDVASFSARIEELLDDPQRRATMGTTGQDRVEHMLSWQCSEAALLKAYARALAGASSPVGEPLSD
jgi:glycosyltransferase involved in cell wall biosynthesis